MLKNYILVALRNIFRQKTYAIINIIGLAIGLTCATLIMLWIQDELSVDRHNEHAEQLSQVYLKVSDNDDFGMQSSVSPMIAGLLKDEYPEVVDVFRSYRLGERVLKTGETRIVESNGIAADPAVMNMMTFDLISGDLGTALNNPASIVLTHSLAQKYFGSTQVVGRVLRMDNQYDLLVSAVIEDLPLNAYRTFDYLVPFSFLKSLGVQTEGEMYFPCSFQTFALLQPGTNVDQLSAKVSKRTFQEGDVVNFEITLLPFTETYLLETGGDKRNNILFSIALIVLAIACINFMNLSTATSSVRAKEIAVRKVSGANWYHIARQYLFESIFTSLLAGLLALIMSFLLIDRLNLMTGKHLSLNVFDPVFMVAFCGIIIITGIMAGLYPAIYISRFQPIKIFQNKKNTSGRGAFRKILIVTQFVFSIGFIIITIFFTLQLKYIKNFDLGVNEYNIIYTPLKGNVVEKYESLKATLLQDANIAHVTTASNLPIAIRNGSFFVWGREDNTQQRICQSRVGYDFLETFGLEMAKGRFFSSDFNDENSIIVNETALKQAGMQDAPMNSSFYYGGRNLTLVGVIKDFHHRKNLTDKPEPLSFGLSSGASTYLFVKIRPEITDIQTITATVNRIQDICNQFSPERPLSCRYMSDYSFQFVRNQEMVQKLVLYSAIFSIFISCMGLFGLAAFINQQRTKETGIRKVLGASVRGILVKSILEYSKWVIVANLIAWPIAWYFVQKWLENFAYRISIQWWVFVIAGLAAFAFAVITLSWQAYKAANADPIKALRYE